MPIRFCSPESVDVLDRLIDGDRGSVTVEQVDCMDASVITIIAPVTAVVSIIAIALYCLLDFFVRCQKECCSTPVRPGVAAAFGVAAQPPAAARAQAVPLLDDSRVGHPTTRVQQQKRHLLPGRTRVLDEEAAARALQPREALRRAAQKTEHDSVHGRSTEGEWRTHTARYLSGSPSKA